jgi:hypothetical protein
MVVKRPNSAASWGAHKNIFGMPHYCDRADCRIFILCLESRLTTQKKKLIKWKYTTDRLEATSTKNLMVARTLTYHLCKKDVKVAQGE